MRLVDETSEAYERATVLCSVDGEEMARELERDMLTRIERVQIVPIDITDPSDYAQLFDRLGPITTQLATPSKSRRSGAVVNDIRPLDVLLSAGTPQMQTLWVILVQSGLLDARMLQVIPAAFVPSVHPNAVREVHLDIDGFPEIRALRHEVLRLRAQTRILGGHLVGDSPPMHQMARALSRIAPTDLPVLIHGETGTGKELVARAIHESSMRASRPLITENCGALSGSMLASELFGHEKGAFTGALGRKRGLFELAHGGTLLLDEVGELTPRMQVNLLRVLQDGSLRRVGGEHKIHVDVRVLAATHRDLQAMVREGSFREDLYYRLRGAIVTVPPLRARIEDLELLIAHFMQESGHDNDHRPLRVKREVWRCLRDYHWPGNVRQLRSEVMRWRVFCDHSVERADLSPEIIENRNPTSDRWVTSPSDPFEATGTESTLTTERALRPLSSIVAEAERTAITHALTVCGHNLSRTANRLQIDRNTLKRKLRRLDIEYQARSAGRPVET